MIHRPALDPNEGEVDELDFALGASNYICPGDGVRLIPRAEGGRGFRCPICRKSLTELIGRPVRISAGGTASLRTDRLAPVSSAVGSAAGE